MSPLVEAMWPAGERHVYKLSTLSDAESHAEFVKQTYGEPREISINVIGMVFISKVGECPLGNFVVAVTNVSDT